MAKKKKNEIYEGVNDFLKDVKNVNIDLPNIKAEIKKANGKVSIKAKKKNFWER